MRLVSLKSEDEFKKVNKKGRKIYTPYFLLIRSEPFSLHSPILPCPTDQLSFFFGIKAGKKLGKAVIRNKIKRRLRHLMRLILSIKISSFTRSIGLIIIPRKGLEKVNFDTLYTEFKKVF